MANNLDRHYGYKIDLPKGMLIHNNLRVYINEVLQLGSRGAANQPELPSSSNIRSIL